MLTLFVLAWAGGSAIAFVVGIVTLKERAEDAIYDWIAGRYGR